MADANLFERRIMFFLPTEDYQDAKAGLNLNFLFEKLILKGKSIVAIFSDTIFKQHILALAVHKELILLTKNLLSNQCFAQP